MSEQKFKTEMRRAQIMQDSGDPDYWQGYMRGLRRAYYGDKFGNETEHKKILSLIKDKEEYRKKIDTGYADAIRYFADSSEIGRPSVGDVSLPAILVKTEMSEQLKTEAENKNLSMPELRRMAYKKIVGGKK